MLELGLLFYLEPQKMDNIHFENEWRQIHNYSKNAPFTYETGPMFVDENDFPEDDNTYFVNNHQDGHYSLIIVNAYMYIYYFIDNRVYYRKSLNKITKTLMRINPIKIAVLDENHTSEILEVIKDKITGIEITEDKVWLEFNYEYNPTTGSLNTELIRVENEDGKIDKVHTEFKFHYEFPSYKTFFEDTRQVDEILRFFNQEINATNYQKLLSHTYHKKFENNIWDRKKCIFHSSFSNANFGYLGMNNDFYQNPSKLFSFNETSMDFYLAFTSNGREHWIPRHIDFIVELIYIYAVEDVVVVVT
jgi:hypothetical protein